MPTVIPGSTALATTMAGYGLAPGAFVLGPEDGESLWQPLPSRGAWLAALGGGLSLTSWRYLAGSPAQNGPPFRRIVDSAIHRYMP